MPRETFQQELDELVADVIELGTEVADALESVVEAMMDRDAKVVEPELGVDARYKARGAQIERACMTLQARQAPVARDLRVLHSTRSVTNHLVRSGACRAHLQRHLQDRTIRQGRGPRGHPHGNGKVRAQHLRRGARHLQGSRRG